jgi:hypothetical protein
VFLHGCATIQHPTTHAVCVALDLASTYVALESGFVEANPIVAGLLSAGGWPLVIAVNVGLIYILYKHREKEEVKVATGIGTVVRCAAAVNNFLL